MNMHEEEHKLVLQSTTTSLFELMKIKPFSEITITELIKKAGIARSTYYRNFHSKEDIIKHYFEEMLTEYRRRYSPVSIEDRYSDEFFSTIVEFLLPHIDTIQIINKAGVSSYFLTMLNDYLLDFYCNSDKNSTDCYKVYAIAGAEYNMIFNWFSGKKVSDIEVLRRYLSEKKLQK